MFCDKILKMIKILKERYNRKKGKHSYLLTYAYSLTGLLTDSLTHSLTCAYSLTHSLTHSPTHSLILTPSLLLTHSLTLTHLLAGYLETMNEMVEATSVAIKQMSEYVVEVSEKMGDRIRRFSTSNRGTPRYTLTHSLTHLLTHSPYSPYSLTHVLTHLTYSPYLLTLN